MPNKPIGRRIGLDVHRDEIFVTELSLADGTVRQHRLSTDEKTVEAYLNTLGPDDHVALEATRGSRHYVQLLQKRVGGVALANPVKLRTLSGATAKNDRNDSFSLALLLAVGTLPTVWVPDQETQQDRDLLRYRNTLIQEQTRIKNRVRAQLAEHGVRCNASDIQGHDARLFLLKLTLRLPRAARTVLTCQLETLEHSEKQLTHINDEIEVRAAERPQVALLMTIRGLDVLLAFTILAEIGSIDRFPTPDSLANYAGLVPRQRASAGHSHLGGVTKAGSGALRWAATQAALCLAQQAQGPYRDLCRRLERKKKHKGVQIAACARKLLEAIWHMLTSDEPFYYAEPNLMQRKTQRRERRLASSRERLVREKDRSKEVMARQLALLQELSRTKASIPLPTPLRATMGGLQRATPATRTPVAIG